MFKFNSVREMLKNTLLLKTVSLGLALGFLGGSVRGDFIVSIFNPTGGGTAVFAPNSLNAVDIYISNNDELPIAGFDLAFAVGDGNDGDSEPSISSFVVDGGGFFLDTRPVMDLPTVDINGSEASVLVVFDPNTTLDGSQLLGRATIDTTGFSSGTYSLSLALPNTFITAVIDEDGEPYAITLNGGSFEIAAVPEPTTLGFVVLLGVGGLRSRRHLGKLLRRSSH